MQIEPYLQRIGNVDTKEINLETLKQLQGQHMLHVPFENLDVINRIPIPLDVETFYKKIVLHHRGGYCYELNGLFNYFIQKLGFQSNFVSATIHKPDGSWAKDGSHACLIVELDQPYLVDVGFGDSARTPLPLTGEPRQDISGTYRVTNVGENIFDLQRQESTHEWNTLYRFDNHPKQLNEFAEANYFNQNSPESHFTQQEIVTLATLDGRITLSGNNLTFSRNGDKKKTTINDNEKPFILDKYFHIRI